MDKRLGFNVEFHRMGARYEKPLTAEDSHEVGQKALACAYALVFFMAGINPAVVEETDNDTYEFFLKDMGDIIAAFISVGYNALDELEARCEGLEKGE